jgi:hypothetical protein
MRRLAWITTGITAVFLVYGLIDFLTNYNWAQGDQNPFQGNPNILLNDGATVLIAGGFLAIGSVIMWVVALRQKEQDDQPKS